MFSESQRNLEDPHGLIRFLHSIPTEIFTWELLRLSESLFCFENSEILKKKKVVKESPNKCQSLPIFFRVHLDCFYKALLATVGLPVGPAQQRSSLYWVIPGSGTEKNLKSTSIASALTALPVPGTKHGDCRSWNVFLTFRTLSQFPFCLSNTSKSTKSLSPSVFSEWCYWSPTMRSWNVILQSMLDRLMLVFHLPTVVVGACLPLPIKSLPVWCLLMDVHLLAQAHQVWHQLFVHLSKPPLSSPSLVPGLPPPVLCYGQNEPRKYTSDEGGLLLQKSPFSNAGGVTLNMFLWPFL